MSTLDERTTPESVAFEVGTTLPPLVVRFTRADLVRYAGASTDFNPIHYSERFAAAVGLPGVIAHGMLTMGTALRVVTDWVGDPARVRSYAARFTKPVVVPDDDDGVEVSFTASVTAVDQNVATVTIEATSNGVKVLGAARVEVEIEARESQTDGSPARVAQVRDAGPADSSSAR